MTRLLPGPGVLGVFLAVIGLSAIPCGTGAAPLKERDPLFVGTKWKGKLTQKGTFAGGVEGPPSFDILLTVTARDDHHFAADLTEESPGIKFTYLLKGTVTPDSGEAKGYRVSFKSVGAKDVSGTTPIVGIPYTGTVSGAALRGTWKLAKAGPGQDLAGDFTAQLVD